MEPAPEVLRQVVLTNSLDYAGRVADGGQAVGTQLLGPGVLVKGRVQQCLLGTPAVFVDSGLVVASMLNTWPRRRSC